LFWTECLFARASVEVPTIAWSIFRAPTGVRRRMKLLTASEAMIESSELATLASPQQ
jgi:hypothetical protein